MQSDIALHHTTSMTDTYVFTAMIWLYPGMAAWHFISVPVELSAELTDRYAHQKRGWGSLKVQVQLGGVVWLTSIFPDKKTGTYLLPLKKDIRRQAKLAAGDTVECTLTILC